MRTRRSASTTLRLVLSACKGRAVGRRSGQDDFGSQKTRPGRQLDAQRLAEARPGKQDQRLGAVFGVGPGTEAEADALQGAVGRHGVDLLGRLVGDMDLGAGIQAKPQLGAVALNQPAGRGLHVHHGHARHGRVEVPRPGAVKRVADKGVAQPGRVRVDGKGQPTHPPLAGRAGRALGERLGRIGAEDGRPCVRRRLARSGRDDLGRAG